jgi:hypothetical protein
MQSMPITTEVVSTNSANVKCKSMQYYIIMVGGFLLVLRFPPHNNIESHDIAEILLKVELNTITLTHIRTNNMLFSNFYNLGEDGKILCVWKWDLYLHMHSLSFSV